MRRRPTAFREPLSNEGGRGSEAAGPRVLLVTPQPFFRASGTPISVAQTARALAGLGFEVDIVSFPHGETLRQPGVNQHRTRSLPFMQQVPVGYSAAKLFYDALLTLLVLRLKRKTRYAAIHAVEEAAFMLAPFMRQDDPPLIVDLDSDICEQLRAHNSWLGRVLAVPAGHLRLYALRHSSCALTVAPALTKLVKRLVPDANLFEIRDAAFNDVDREPDLALVDRLRAEHALEGRRPILYTGNLDRRQGVALVVKALPDIVRQYPNVIFLVVGGERHEIHALEELAAEVGVSSHLLAIGKRPLSLMPEYMALAELLVSPRLEPFMTPMKLYAYMASGRPIVATDLPTHRAVVDDDSAILTAPTVEGLCAAILKALLQPHRSRYIGLRARSIVERLHSQSRFDSQIAEAYASIGIEAVVSQLSLHEGGLPRAVNAGFD